MKKLVTMTSLLILFATSEALAGGGCPTRAKNLEAFAGCMVPMQGEVGTMYRGTLAQLNGDSHRNLMYVMNTRPVVRPHPVSMPMGVWMPMASVAAHQAYASKGHTTFWTWYSMRNLTHYPYSRYPYY